MGCIVVLPMHLSSSAYREHWSLILAQVRCAVPFQELHNRLFRNHLLLHREPQAMLVSSWTHMFDRWIILNHYSCRSIWNVCLVRKTPVPPPILDPVEDDSRQISSPKMLRELRLEGKVLASLWMSKDMFCIQETILRSWIPHFQDRSKFWIWISIYEITLLTMHNSPCGRRPRFVTKSKINSEQVALKIQSC